MRFEGFLTGSHAYGQPRQGFSDAWSNSDVDLAICVDDETFQTLKANADPTGPGSGERERSLRFGSLNVICLTPEEFAAWREANDELVAQRPVTRDKAVRVIERFFKDRKVPRNNNGGW